MIIFLVLIGGAVGVFFGPIGLIAGAILGAMFAHSIFDESYEPQGFDDNPDHSFTLFDPDSPRLQGDDLAINPTTGLPMLGGDIGGIDVGGNPYGFDISNDTSPFDESIFIDTGFSDDPHSFL
ncbi:hypothetical protein [Marinobacter sp. S6332]|uniref:hypothetical protein n=1 Tax=Marinobacter sp. S6332 TaxID=2926403 RepID=UPI001FF2095E|nr:hypothetical protein [Marinobacter sp. S6332]MCK0165751.1 hypothetical protein [Marinobacter sp. S6332]